MCFLHKNIKRYRFPTHINDLVMDRSQATASEVFIVVISPGGAPPLHQHDDTEQIFYVLEGRGRLEIGAESEEFLVEPGDVVRIPPATLHRIHCLGPAICAIWLLTVSPQAGPMRNQPGIPMCKQSAASRDGTYDDVLEKLICISTFDSPICWPFTVLNCWSALFPFGWQQAIDWKHGGI